MMSLSAIEQQHEDLPSAADPRFSAARSRQYRLPLQAVFSKPCPLPTLSHHSQLDPCSILPRSFLDPSIHEGSAGT
ncbi:hypothetical protein M433DRAFT_223844, partial [Acidomyces richmondensis BFW]